MDLLSPILINFQMILGNTPELVQNLTNEDLGQMLKLNPILCRVELRPAKNNLPALFEIMINNQINLNGYYKEKDDSLWKRIHQRELLGVAAEGFEFMIELLNSVYIKARVKPKRTTFLKNKQIGAPTCAPNQLIIPQFNSVRKKVGDLGKSKPQTPTESLVEPGKISLFEKETSASPGNYLVGGVQAGASPEPKIKILDLVESDGVLMPDDPNAQNHSNGIFRCYELPNVSSYHSDDRFQGNGNRIVLKREFKGAKKYSLQQDKGQGQDTFQARSEKVGQDRVLSVLQNRAGSGHGVVEEGRLGGALPGQKTCNRESLSQPFGQTQETKSMMSSVSTIFEAAKSKFELQNAAEGNDSKCCICYSDENIQIAGKLDCGHVFCYSCILDWSKVCNTCPLCKTPFFKITKQVLGKDIEYTEIKERPARPANPDQYMSLENADEKCYKCGTEGNTDLLLVCDNCNVRCCHIHCLDPPIDYIPKGEWYCDECCRKDPTLVNKYERPQPVIFPESFQQALPPLNSQIIELEQQGSSSSLQSSSKQKKKGRRRGKMENPLIGVSEAIETNNMQEKLKRKDRAEKRRKIELGKQGSLSRRRRYRIREGKKKRRAEKKNSIKLAIGKENSDLELQKSIKKRIMPKRKSKSLSIDKYINYVKYGVDVRKDISDPQRLPMGVTDSAAVDRKKRMNHKIIQSKLANTPPIFAGDSSLS